MGNSLGGPAVAACSIPLRTFIGTPVDGAALSLRCADERVARTFGACIVVALAVFVLAVLSERMADDQRRRQEEGRLPVNEPDAVVVPRAVAVIPLLYLIYVVLSARRDADFTWSTETVNFAASGMEKGTFLQHRSNDERSATGSNVGLLGTAAITLGGLLGPWVRADGSPH